MFNVKKTNDARYLIVKAVITGTKIMILRHGVIVTGDEKSLEF